MNSYWYLIYCPEKNVIVLEMKTLHLTKSQHNLNQCYKT
jgi:hypothetical protein